MSALWKTLITPPPVLVDNATLLARRAPGDRRAAYRLRFSALVCAYLHFPALPTKPNFSRLVDASCMLDHRRITAESPQQSAD